MNLEGDISEINLVERLVEFWRQHFTGAIRFENDGVIKILYLKDGDVLSASTNDRADSVDEILMKAGKVGREHVKQALAKRKENETLGDALLNLGFITRKELTWARRVQVVNVIRSVGAWEAGSFTVVADYLPKREEGTIFPLPQIVIEVIVTDHERQKYERALESGSVVFEKTSEFPEAFGRLGLNEDAEKIANQIDGQRTAAEVAEAAGQEAFNTFKLLHALSVLGLIARRRTGAEPAPANEFDGAGVADAADAWSVPVPQFDLDDAPPPAELAGPAPVIATPPAVEEHPMPAWDAPPRQATPSFAPAPEPPAEAAEERWKFDVPAPAPPVGRPAPVTAARKVDGTAARRPDGTATRRPVLSAPARKHRSYGLLIALMVVFILAGLAYGGYLWWSAKQAEPAVVAVRRPLRQRPPVAPATIPAPVPAATTATTATTASVAPPPVMQTPAPAPAAQPLRVTPSMPARAPAKAATVPAAASPLRERIDAMAREFASTPQGNFTLQFEIVCEPANVQKALGAGGTNVWFVPITLKGRGCYRVFWGRYPTREAAERSAGEIPSALREGKASVVEVPRS